MGILFLLKEHGDMEFEELANIMGSSSEPIELMARLNRLENEGLIMTYKNGQDVTIYTRIVV